MRGRQRPALLRSSRRSAHSLGLITLPRRSVWTSPTSWPPWQPEVPPAAHLQLLLPAKLPAPHPSPPFQAHLDTCARSPCPQCPAPEPQCPAPTPHSLSLVPSAPHPSPRHPAPASCPNASHPSPQYAAPAPLHSVPPDVSASLRSSERHRGTEQEACPRSTPSVPIWTRQPEIQGPGSGEGCLPPLLWVLATSWVLRFPTRLCWLDIVWSAVLGRRCPVESSGHSWGMMLSRVTSLFGLFFIPLGSFHYLRPYWYR